MKASPLLLAVLALAACSDRPSASGPLAVSLIGGTPRLADPSRGPLDATSAVLVGAVAQGLVRFDAQGQVEAGLAIRWDVSDDGLYYTFRIADGAPIDAEAAARLLRAAIARASRNPLKPLLDPVDEIVAVTPEVIEIRLAQPRSDLLELLAQPELALIKGGSGGGPFRLTETRGQIVLAPLAPAAADETPEEARAATVRLSAGRAALGVVRFAAGSADVVTGGTFADLPVVSAADLDVRALRFDPVKGLFGLLVVNPRGPLADVALRQRLDRAIDRARIITLIGAPGLILPVPLPAPTTPPTTPPPSPEPLTLSIALPDGAGATQLFRLIAADWSRIGVTAVRVPLDDRTADLRLVDEVAPSDAADWPLVRLGCQWLPEACSSEAGDALAAARAAPTPAERQAALAEAVRLQRTAAWFMPIAHPVRWSLVARALGGWQENARAIHPLDQLRR